MSVRFCSICSVKKSYIGLKNRYTFLKSIILPLKKKKILKKLNIIR